MGLAGMLGSYVYELSFSDLPQNIVPAIEVRILDFLGTAFDCLKRYPLTPVIKVLKTLSTKKEATVIGEGVKLPCSLAAMVNCHYGLSDGSRFAGLHPANVVVPAALAVAETQSSKTPVSGRDLMLAIALG